MSIKVIMCNYLCLIKNEMGLALIMICSESTFFQPTDPFKGVIFCLVRAILIMVIGLF